MAGRGAGDFFWLAIGFMGAVSNPGTSIFVSAYFPSFFLALFVAFSCIYNSMKSSRENKPTVVVDVHLASPPGGMDCSPEVESCNLCIFGWHTPRLRPRLTELVKKKIEIKINLYTTRIS